MFSISTLHAQVRLRGTRSALAALVLLVAPGCHAGIGPQIGYTFGDAQSGLSYGWEVSGGASIFRAAGGQVFRGQADRVVTAEGAPAREVITYAALEPWYYAGATLGYAWSDRTSHGLSAGLWVGAPFPIDLGRIDGCPISQTGCFFALTGAIGFRYLSTGLEIYFTPKLNLVEDVQLF